VIIKAKYALLGPGMVRKNVRIEYDGKRILSVRDGYAPGGLRTDFDFGLACVIPGLINAHCHLELEFAAGQASFDGSFVRWLQSVRDLKRERTNQLTTYPELSLRQLAASGCTTVVDHHSVALDWRHIKRFGLRHLPMREVFEFNNHSPVIAALAELVEYSLAPHAPYTASIEMARACRKLADGLGRPLSTHLSEFRGEIEFIKTGHDPEIDELNVRAGVGDAVFAGTGLSPVKYYAREGVLTPQTFSVHTNYLADGDLEVLAEIKPCVVYCPRSHAFFRHAPHPLEQLLAADIPVALGSDSLASNSSLSPLEEAKYVREHYPQVTSEKIFELVTSNALRPLGWQRQYGMLLPGYYADLAVFPLPLDPGDNFGDLFDTIMEVGESALTVCEGRTIWNPRELKLAA
jgi:cytosine/adenosine deaminase-related metal-dependent hydrolase